jgi:Zn finger protein HypA/HybF involved in hydrogenase expression
MGRVQISKHITIKVSRRSLCDNCTAELCVYNHGSRVERCDRFTPVIVAFKKCHECGEMFEVTSNFRSLDYELCPRCNDMQQLSVGDEE